MAKRRTFSSPKISTSVATLDTIKGPPLRKLSWETPRGTGPGWNTPEVPIEITRSEMLLAPGDIMFRLTEIPGLVSRLGELFKTGKLNSFVPSFRMEGGTAVVHDTDIDKFGKALKNLGMSDRKIDKVFSSRQTKAAAEHKVRDAVQKAKDTSSGFESSPLRIAGGSDVITLKAPENRYLSLSPVDHFSQEVIEREAELNLYRNYLQDLKEKAPQRFFNEISNDSYLMKLAKKWKMVD